MPEMSTIKGSGRRLRGSGTASTLFDAFTSWPEHERPDGRIIARSWQTAGNYTYDEGFEADAPVQPFGAVQVRRTDSHWEDGASALQPVRRMRQGDGRVAERITAEALRDLDFHRIDSAINAYSDALRALLPAPLRQEVAFVQAEDDSFYRLTVLLAPEIYSDAERLVDLHMQVEEAVSLIAPEFEGYFALRFRRSDGEA